MNKLQWNIDNRARDRWRILKKSVNSSNSIYLFIASNWKYQSKEWDLFKINKKDTRTTSLYNSFIPEIATEKFHKNQFTKSLFGANT